MLPPYGQKITPNRRIKKYY